MIPRLHFPDAGPERVGRVGRVGEFTPEQARRLFRVLRMRRGDSVVLFDGEGNEFAAEIESLSPDSGAARIVSQLPQPAADPDIRARIGQALCAPNKMDWAIEKMTELGATHITPLLTAKTAPTKFSPSRANRLAIAACEQCGRAHAPNIREAERLSDFLSHPFPDARKILLSPNADDSLAKVLTKVLADAKGTRGLEVVFLSGPESGLTPAEEAQANSAGYLPAHMGPRILRAETAALAALAILEAVAR